MTREAAQGGTWTLGSTELEPRSACAAHATLGNLCIFYFSQLGCVVGMIEPTLKGEEKASMKNGSEILRPIPGM